VQRPAWPLPAAPFPSWRSGSSDLSPARTGVVSDETVPLHRTISRALRSAVLALLLLLPAAGPATAASCSGGDASAAVVCEIAAERGARALPPLRPDDRLALAARRHARHMVRSSFFSHVTPDGATMTSRLRAVGYIDPAGSWAVGEVLAWGRGSSGTAESIVDAWMASPPHRRVLLGRRYRDVGVGATAGDPFGGGGITFAAELGARG
jgi:uncharacterized protein YkwD